MTLNDIIRRAHKYKGLELDCYDNKKINDNIFEILRICIKKKIRLSLNERDIVKIIQINYSRTNNYYNEFIEEIINLSKRKIDIKKVYDLL